MEFRENQTYEFKKKYTQGIKKEVVAFVNSEGGNLYIDIDVIML